jgi:hypothetical protein
MVKYVHKYVAKNGEICNKICNIIPKCNILIWKKVVRKIQIGFNSLRLMLDAGKISKFMELLEQPISLLYQTIKVQ